MSRPGENILHDGDAEREGESVKTMHVTGHKNERDINDDYHWEASS